MDAPPLYYFRLVETNYLKSLISHLVSRGVISCGAYGCQQSVHGPVLFVLKARLRQRSCALVCGRAVLVVPANEANTHDVGGVLIARVLVQGALLEDPS